MALAGISTPKHLAASLDVDGSTAWRWLVAKNTPRRPQIVRMTGILLWFNQRYDLTTRAPESLWHYNAVERLEKRSKVNRERLLSLMGGAALTRREWHEQEWWRFFELTQMQRLGYRLESIQFLNWRKRETRWKDGTRPRLKRAPMLADELLPYDPLDGHMSLRFGGVDAPSEEEVRARRRMRHPTKVLGRGGMR